MGHTSLWGTYTGLDKRLPLPVSLENIWPCFGNANTALALAFETLELTDLMLRDAAVPHNPIDLTYPTCEKNCVKLCFCSYLLT